MVVYVVSLVVSIFATWMTSLQLDGYLPMLGSQTESVKLTSSRGTSQPDLAVTLHIKQPALGINVHSTLPFQIRPFELRLKNSEQYMDIFSFL